MAAFNKVILIGNLTADPELKTTQNGVSVTSFSIAVRRKFNSNDTTPQTDFINIVAWRGTAEFICNYFQKGKAILIVGSIQTRNWTDQEGQKRYVTEVVAEEAQFVEKKSDSASPAEASKMPSNGTQTSPCQEPIFVTNSSKTAYSDNSVAFEEMTGDDDLPF